MQWIQSFGAIESDIKTCASIHIEFLADSLMLFDKRRSVSGKYLHYMKIKDYIRNIQYDYIETFSLLRGKKNDLFYKDLFDEIKDIEKSMKEVKFGWYRQTKRLAELEKYINRTQYILTDSCDFHPTSEKVSTINANDGDDFLLNVALCSEYDKADDFETACAPTYRDALVFFDGSNNIITALNICFECKKMYSKEKGTIFAHHKNYQQLAKFLRSKGHDI